MTACGNNVEQSIQLDSGAEVSDAAPLDAAVTALDAGLIADIGFPDSGAVMCESNQETACGVVCTNLNTDPRNCGSCGTTCIVPQATAACSAGQCTVGTCDFGYFDKDGLVENGCEFADTCVPDQACTTTCNSEGLTACEQGILSCVPPAEICNGVDDNCDGQCDEGPIAGCRVGIHRGFGNGHIFSDNIATVESDPYSVESRNYFYLYAQAVADTRPVFLCRKSDTKRFLTTRTDCDMNGARERQIGFIATQAVCGAAPLYKLYKESANNHFYTVSAPERDNAVNNLGYLDQGILGYIWTGEGG